MKKKVLFVIHDLKPGGAERVLVNLVNHMNHNLFDITVLSIFNEGVYMNSLHSNIKYKYSFSTMPRGNTRFMKLLSPQQLHSWLIKEHYDIEIAYLEGPSTRIVSGCQARDTKLLAWVHGKLTHRSITTSYRSIKEVSACYDRFDTVVCVSEDLKHNFVNLIQTGTPVRVLYNTNDTERITQLAADPIKERLINPNEFSLIGVGKLAPIKGFDRLINITGMLSSDGYPVHTFIVGDGPQKKELMNQVRNLGLTDKVSLLGYQSNPYKYISKCSLFVCSSHSEGFSTAATEALILGTPVCTVNVPGMKELLGQNNDYGLITENSEQGLYQGIKKLIETPTLLQHYRDLANKRSLVFSTSATVKDVQNMLLSL